MEQAVLRPTEDELMEREEKCRKALRTLNRALFMRLFVTVVLALALIRAGHMLALGLMGFVLIITLAGSVPLVQEWKKQRALLKDILDQYE